MSYKYIYIYIYIKDLRLRSNESRDHGDGNLVPSRRCGFGFEAASALRPEIKHFRIHKKCYFRVKFVVSANIFVQDCSFS